MMNMFVRTPWHFWLVAVLGIFWFAGGAYDYVMTVMSDPGYLAQLTDDQRAWIDARPIWFTVAWTVSIWSSLLGGIVMLFRSRLAVSLFWASLGGYFVACIWSYILSNPSAFSVTGWFGIAFSVAIAFSIFFFLRYCIRMHNRGVLR